MHDRLRICMATDAYLPGVGGVENHTYHLAAELERLGHEVVVVTHQIPRNTPAVEGQVRSPVPVVRLAGAVLVHRDHDVAIDPRMLGGLARLLSGGRFDIVHGQSEGSFLVYCALALARLSGTPTVLTRHSVLATRPGLARPLAQLLARMLLPLADGVLAVSNAVAGERLGFRGPIHVVPNGVDPDEFRPIPDLRARTRHDLGFEDGHIVVGFTGRLHSNKGVELLVRAFESAGSAEPELRLLLVGPGPLCAVLESSESARQGRIRLLQAQPYDRVAGLLNAMDLFAFPSAREAFGISLLEAMACGLPSIAMGRLGVLDLAMDGVTGLLAHNEASFAAGLRRLASDASLRQEMGRKARERAATMFAWQRVAADTVRHYHELAERDAGRGE